MEESSINMAISMLEEIQSETQGTNDIVIKTNDGDAYWYYVDNDEKEALSNAIHLLRNMVRGL